MYKNRQANYIGLKRLLYAGKYSLEGILAAFQTEAAFRCEVIIIVISITVALLAPLSAVFKAFLTVSSLGVLIAELVNTAIETIVDIIFEDVHPSAKRAKDLGSAVVMLSIINLIVAWLFAGLQMFRG